MLYLKGCPRCRGDLLLETSSTESDLVCLQCSFRTDARRVQRYKRIPTPVAISARSGQRTPIGDPIAAS
jgi:hypothetical protein